MPSRHCLLATIYQVKMYVKLLLFLYLVQATKCNVFFFLHSDISILLKMTEMSPQDTLLNNKFSWIEDVFVRNISLCLSLSLSLLFYLSPSICFFKTRWELLHECSSYMFETNICTYSSLLSMFAKHVRKRDHLQFQKTPSFISASFCKAAHIFALWLFSFLILSSIQHVRSHSNKIPY